MILLGVENENELLNQANTCWDKDISHKLFYEPDINQHTALAISPDVNGELFKHLKLL